MFLLVQALALGLVFACTDAERASAPTPVEQTAADLVQDARARFRDPPAAAQGTAAEGTQRAEQLVSAGSYEAALAVLEGVQRAQPGAGRARFLLAYCHHKQKRYAQARPHFEAVLAKGPTFDRAHVVFYLYGWCLWYLGEVDGARAAMEAMLEFDPTERDARYALGLIALEQGRAEDAERELRASLVLIEELRAGASESTLRQLKRDEAKAHARLAELALLANDLDAAKAGLERSLNLNPANYEAWFKLSRVHTRLGDDARAAQALELHRQWKERAGR
ncbi:MAG: tetratricopeptide repeat protein [bacterium]|nr:tetratricopeptide repeat protein [bacterium]